MNGRVHQGLRRPDRAGARGAARPGDLRAARGVPREGADPGRVGLRGGRARSRGVVGEAVRGAARLGAALGHRARRVGRALLQVVRGREAERLAPGARSPRGGRARRPRGVPLAWGGGRGARRDLRRAAARREAAGERAEGPRDRAGRRGRHLPADDPRGGRGDARVRAHRRAAQRGLRRLLAGLGEGADGVLGREGADHGRPGPAQGQGGRHQAGCGQVPRRRALDRDRDRGPQHRQRRADGRRTRRLLRRGDRGGVRRLPSGAVRRRAPALRALHERLDRQAEGDPAHHGRLPHRGGLDAQARVRPQAGRGRVLVLRRRRLGHRATPTSSTGR